MFDLTKTNEYREGNRLEVKRAQGGLPDSLWETYAAFANTDGGIILLGATENDDKSLCIVGVSSPESLIKTFWDTLSNRQKVSVNILTAKNMTIEEIDGKKIVVINIPRAVRQDKPVYLKKDIYGQSFRRNGEGDYHCTQSEVKNMVRDSGDVTQDKLVLDKYRIDILNTDTIKRYRLHFSNIKSEHILTKLGAEEFLQKIGAIKRSDNDGNLHPTLGGLLMFGNIAEILDEYPNYFLDYREPLDPIGERWSDRVTSRAVIFMFSLVGIGERAGSGLFGINMIWEQYKLPKPDIKEQFNPDRTILTLPLADKSVGINDGIKLTATEKRILDLIIRNGEITVLELSESIGKDSRTIERGIRKLRDNAIIERDGSKKTGTWVVKGK